MNAYFCNVCGVRIACLASPLSLCVACAPSLGNGAFGATLYVDPQVEIDAKAKAEAEKAEAKAAKKAALPPEVPAAHGETESKAEKAEKPKKP